jgi:hypothetical protein
MQRNVPGNFTPFECNLISKLQRRLSETSCATEFLPSEVRLVSLQADRFRLAMSEPCKTLPGKESLESSSVMICGETRFSVFDTGMTTNPRPHFDKFCERESTRPHAVLIGHENALWALEIAAKWDIPVYKIGDDPMQLASQISSDIKSRLITRLLTKDYRKFARSHQRGFVEAQTAAQKEFASAMMAATIAGRSKAIADVRFRDQLQVGGAFLPSELCDPITGRPMRDPVVTRSGATYDRASILPYLMQTGKDPVSRLPLTPADLVPNRLYADLLRCVGLNLT